MNIALIGKTGSGKSTLAKRLAQEFDFEIISSDILRDYIVAKCEGWETVQAAMKVGNPIPVSMTTKALELKLENSTSENFIIDNLVNASFLNAFEKHHNLDFAFYLEIDDEVAIQRVISRARGEEIEHFLKSRSKWFTDNFPKLQSALGDRLILINTNDTPDAIYKQVSKFLR
ncbi:MAG: nucleoside monophosphate kinase [Christensenellaceae bacterium]|nr:nucleoside monophosphate kinase [Christensenellaceae bacterium]